MHPAEDLFVAYARTFEAHREAELSLSDYLTACREDPLNYATATERLLAAIGEPEMVDTSKDARLGRIFMNRTIRRYPSFAEFYGMEETIERIVGFLRHAAQGLEERKQIMYLLGPVGGGKSSLAERLKALMETYPIYVLNDAIDPGGVLRLAGKRGQRGPKLEHHLLLKVGRIRGAPREGAGDLYQDSPVRPEPRAEPGFAVWICFHKGIRCRSPRILTRLLKDWGVFPRLSFITPGAGWHAAESDQGTSWTSTRATPVSPLCPEICAV